MCVCVCRTPLCSGSLSLDSHAETPSQVWRQPVEELHRTLKSQETSLEKTGTNVCLLLRLKARHHLHFSFDTVSKTGSQRGLTAFAGNARSMTALKPLYREATPSSLTSSLRTSRKPLGYFPSGAERRVQQQQPLRHSSELKEKPPTPQDLFGNAI